MHKVFDIMSLKCTLYVTLNVKYLKNNNIWAFLKILQAYTPQ